MIGGFDSRLASCEHGPDLSILELSLGEEHMSPLYVAFGHEHRASCMILDLHLIPIY